MTTHTVGSGQSVTGTTVTFGNSLDVLNGGLAVSARILSGGAETIENGGSAYGTLVSKGGDQYVDSGAVVSDTTVFKGGAEDVIGGGITYDTVISSGGLLDVGHAGFAMGTLVGAGGVLEITGGSEVFDTKLMAGGSILFDNISAVGTPTITFNSHTDILTVGEGKHDDSILLSGNYAGYHFNYTAVSGSVEVTATPCYLRGAQILTDRGEVSVESLAVGDNLVTLSGEVASLKWIGRRSYAGWLAETNADIQPIRFKAGSLGDNRPNRDLFVSPEHAMYLNGVLIPAKLLVNGISIVVADAMEEVEYYHLELPQHAVIVANGAFSESFVDDDSRGMFHNAHEYAVLYPNEPRSLRAEYCAQRVEDGITLEAVRRELMARAVRLLPDGSLAKTPVLSGNLDFVTRTAVEGWAYENDGAVALAIVDNGVVIGHVTADRYREDLVAAGIGHGRHGFRFVLPQGFSDRVDHRVEVRRVSDWSLLTGAPSTLKAKVQTDAAHLLAAE